MMTWSPVSMWRAEIGLCLPRRIRATSVAMRPSTRPSASTTCQARWISDGFGVNVRTRSPSSKRSGLSDCSLTADASKREGLMFVHVTEGKAKDAELLKRQGERWQKEIQPGAKGYLGHTGGVSADGTAIHVVRFEIEADARSNIE